MRESQAFVASWLIAMLLLLAEQRVYGQVIVPLFWENVATTEAIVAASADASGNAWFISKDQLWVSLDGYTVEPPRDFQLSSIVAVGETLLAGGANGGLFKFELVGQDNDAVAIAPVPGWGVAQVAELVADHDGRAMVLARDGKAYLYDEASGSLTLIQEGITWLGVDERDRFWAAEEVNATNGIVKNTLFLFEQNTFSPVGEMDDYLLSFADTGETVYFISSTDSKSMENHTSSASLSYYDEKLNSIKPIKEHRPMKGIGGLGVVDGELWISERLGIQIVGSDDEILIDGSPTGDLRYNFKVIAEANKHAILISASKAVIRRSHKGRVFFTVTEHREWIKEMKGVLRTEKGVFLWGGGGIRRFDESVDLSTKDNIISLIWLGIVFEEKARVVGGSYSPKGLLKEVFGNMVGLLKGDQVPRDLFPTPLESEFIYTIEKQGEKLAGESTPGHSIDIQGRLTRAHITIADSYGNTKRSSNYWVLRISGAKDWVLISLTLLVVVPCLFLISAVEMPLNGRYVLYSIVFVVFSLTPNVFRKLFFLSIPNLMKDVLCRLYMDRWSKKYDQHRILSNPSLTRLIVELRANTIVYCSASTTGVNLENVAIEIAEHRAGVELRKALPVLCHFEHLPDTNHPDLTHLIEEKVVDALDVEIWFFNKEFCKELLLQGQFVFLFYYDAENSRVEDALHLFFANAGTGHRMVTYAV